MTQGSRIKQLRKDLNLTLDKFGERIGLKKSALSLIENEKNDLTDANAKSICREFNVREEWLRTGEGEMYVHLTRSEKITGFAAEVLNDEEESFRRRLLEALSDLDVEEWGLLEKISEKAVKKENG